MSKQKPILAFAHIEKTAGTTVSRRLRIGFGARHLDIKPWKPKMNRLSSHDLSKVLSVFPWIKSIAGHSVKPSEELISRFPNLKFYTFLRDPAERVISLYIHRHEKNKTAGSDFKDWYLKKCINNWQVQFIAGEENLQKAISILENHFLYVGLTESFETSWLEISKIASIPVVKSFHNSSYNYSNNKELKQQLKSDKTIVDFIQHHNKLDVQLYNFVRNEGLNYLNKPGNVEQIVIGSFQGKINYSFNEVANKAYQLLLFLYRSKLNK